MTTAPIAVLGPLSKFIMSVLLLDNSKYLVTLESYNGTGDLKEHFIMFNSMILFNRTTDMVLCRVFPTPSSIYDFSELAKKFLNNFFL